MIEASPSGKRDPNKSYIQARSERKELEKVLTEYTANLVEGGKEAIENRFEYQDSSVGDPFDFMALESSFKGLVPETETSLRNYIEHTLAPRKGVAVGVEFGGPGVNLFESFDIGFFNKTIGVTLADYRKPDEAYTLETHRVLTGDIRDSVTYEKLAKELNGTKVDLIVERLLGGWDYIQDDPVLFGKILSRWYELMNEGGLLIAEAPPHFSTIYKSGEDFEPLLQEWAAKVRAEYGDALVIKVSRAPNYGSGVFSLHKNAGAPETLPLLDIRDLLKPSRK